MKVGNEAECRAGYKRADFRHSYGEAFPGLTSIGSRRILMNVSSDALGFYAPSIIVDADERAVLALAGTLKDPLVALFNG